MTVRDGLADPERPLRPGPTLGAVMQRVAQTPADRVPPVGALGGGAPRRGQAQVDASAVVADALTDLAPGAWRTRQQIAWLRTFFAAPGGSGDQRARAALITTWVLADPAVHSAPALVDVLTGPDETTDWALTAISRVSTVLAPVLDPSTWTSTTATREETARAVLRACGLYPGDETAVDAEARWQTVSTAIQSLVLAQLAEEARRTEELNLALAAKRAREAAAQVSHV